MQKYIKFLLIIIILIYSSCKKDSNSDSDDGVFNKNEEIEQYNFSENPHNKLFLPYKKFELFLGKDFIPIFSLKSNLDTDSGEEIVIAYKQNSTSKINVVIFDLLQNDVLRKKIEFPTEIQHIENFLMQTQNLFYKNNIGLTIEGKTIDNKNKLYIISYLDDDFKIFGDFTGDYSIVIDYEEVDDEKGKYSKIKEVVVINNDLNSNVQKKLTYLWEEVTKQFNLSKEEQIFSQQNSSIDQSILYSEDKYFDYIKGIWYPEKYKTIMEKDNLDLQEFSDTNIRFIFFSQNPNEVQIKYGDYVDKYSIVKIVKLWNQKPGLRMVLKEFTYNTDANYSRYVDATLIEPNLLKVLGPQKFDEDNYVRLKKHFSDFVAEKKADFDKKKISGVIDYLNGKFKNKDEIIININKNKEFSIFKQKNVEKGVYKLTMNKEGYIISFLYNSQNTIISNENFIIKLDDNKGFTLIPIKFDYDKITIQDLNSIKFEKINGE